MQVRVAQFDSCLYDSHGARLKRLEQMSTPPNATLYVHNLNDGVRKEGMMHSPIHHSGLDSPLSSRC